MKRYTRVIVLFGSAFLCVAVNSWLVLAGHYRWPAVVLVVYLAGLPFVIKKLPPSTEEPKQIRAQQAQGVSALRLLGWIFVAGLVVGVLNVLSGGLHDLPWWGIALMFSWNGFLIWGCFWMARRLQNGQRL